MASCTALITDSPDSSTVMLAAITSDGSVAGGSAPTANNPTVETVATRPPTICRKNGAAPQRPSSRPSRSMHAVTTKAVVQITGGPPSSNATAAASPAQPVVRNAGASARADGRPHRRCKRR
jgi:hypothetical protein